MVESGNIRNIPKALTTTFHIMSPQLVAIFRGATYTVYAVLTRFCIKN